MRRLFCWFGLHHYELKYYSHTCDIVQCRCGKVLLVFAYDSRALSEVDRLNELWKQSEGNLVGR